MLCPSKARQSTLQAFVGPRTQTEEKMTSIWSEVLRFSPVGIHDNFFELGGHSLMAIQVISRVRNHFDVELPLRILFENPTVSELCVSVESHRSNGKPKDAPIVSIK